jgi:hypothetical protein
LNSDDRRLHLRVKCRGNHDRPAQDARSKALTMTDELTKKVVDWATETAGYAAQLPSRQARDAYLAARHRELMVGAVAEGAADGDARVLADACVNAARRIMTALLAQCAGVPQGRA